MNDNNGNNAASTAPAGALVIAGDCKKIVVNGREHAFAGDEIGRGELARLAFPALGAGEESALTVAYDHGPHEGRHGLLGSGRTTRVLDGQTFSVSLCDKS